MKFAHSSSLALLVFSTDVQSFTFPTHSIPSMPTALCASVTRKNMSEWERWQNEPVHVSLRPEYHQDASLLNQQRPLSSQSGSTNMFATTKSKPVDDDPWRKVKVDEYTPTGINHQRQYNNDDYQNTNRSYSRMNQDARRGFQNDIRLNYRSVNNNSYSQVYPNSNGVNQNDGYRKEFQNPRYRDEYQQSPGLNQSFVYQQRYHSGHNNMNHAYPQGYQSNRDSQEYQVNRDDSYRNVYRNDIRSSNQSLDDKSRQILNQIKDVQHNDGHRQQFGNLQKNWGRSEFWKSDSSGRGANLKVNQAYTPVTNSYNTFDGYSRTHHNNQREIGQPIDQMHNIQVKRFPVYEDPNFDPTSTIDPVQSSNQQRQFQQQNYSTSAQSSDRNGINYYKNNSNLVNDIEQNHSVSNTYQRVTSNQRLPTAPINTNVYQTGKTDFYQHNQQNTPFHHRYDYDRQEIKRFPTYEKDDDPSCPKETR